LVANDSGYTVTEDNIKLRLELRQFFQYYKVLNANFLAERIGMNPSLLSQYVRGKKQPSAKQAEKIILGIQRIGKELSDINLV
jgi:transcriptional regulator with XRE-family HTH domain